MNHLSCLFLVLILVACGGNTDPLVSDDHAAPDLSETTSGDALQDAALPEVTLPDLRPPQDLPGWDFFDLNAEVELTPDPGSFGYPCQSDDQCISDFCIQTQDGRQCTVSCLDECPSGWTCSLHKPSLPDEVFICAPPFTNLCRPCITNADCTTNGVDTGDRCIQAGPQGAFCGGNCQDGLHCPEGYLCQQSQDLSGQASLQCVLQDGTCTCAQWYIDDQAVTDCSIENQWGSCPGQRWCQSAGLTDCDAQSPGPEQCNGIDDNCNGTVDEETDGDQCFNSSDYGVCTGVYECDDGKLVCIASTPQPEACDGQDNDCDGETDEGFPDLDDDGVADCMETDKDGDGISDYEDNCPYKPNPSQADFDLDNAGDACDSDDDDDKSADQDDCAPLNPSIFPGATEICNGIDENCNMLIDEGFTDTDADGLKNCVDNDDDNDGFHDQEDCLPLDPAVFPGAAELCDGLDNNCNGQTDEGFPDSDGDGQADCLDDDLDQDGIANNDDNCPTAPNPLQEDLDQDGVGDTCDADKDGDGVVNALDNCALKFNPMQADQDEDGLGDACDEDVDGDTHDDGGDNCPTVANPGQEDLDQDGLGDACDSDDDGDNVPDLTDNCPATPNAGQQDTDGDKVGDACEEDLDGDLVPDVQDNCPLHPNKDQQDCDNDGTGAACDDDDDDDDVPDSDDNCLCLKNPVQDDGDGDGLGDVCDTDRDGDGLVNGLDNCPDIFNPPQFDLDQDGDGDPCDEDKDGDGYADTEDCNPVDSAIHPDASESCNGKDDNCNGETDEGLGMSPCGKGQCLHDVPNCFNGLPGLCNPYEGASTEICDGADNDCDGETDEGFPDLDKDGVLDCLDDDDDGDGTPDADDNCPLLANPQQNNFDQDALGDACDPDDDNDGEPDIVDCQPLNGGVSHFATEACNGFDDDCDDQIDEAGALGCENWFMDLDDDGFGAANLAKCLCASDGLYSTQVTGDCSPLNSAIHPQAEEICNGQDDNCDGEIDEGANDFDDDGLADCVDPDADGDAVNDVVDNCLFLPNPEQSDPDGDGDGNACDLDDDGDLIADLDDNCPLEPNAGQEDPDDDGFGNPCDDDDDGDGLGDLIDNCPLVPNDGQENLDNDLLGDACDPDKDGDGSQPPADCDDENPDLYPGKPELLDGKDNNCNGEIDEGVHAASCKHLLQLAPGTASGTCTIDPDGADGPTEPFAVYCDMTTAGGGWTLAGRFSNLDAKQWVDSKSRWTGAETFGDASTLTPDSDAKSLAWSTLVADEMMFTDTNDPGKYMRTTNDCVGGVTLSSLFTTLLANYPTPGPDVKKKCLIDKTYPQSPHWMAEPDWSGETQGSGNLGPNQGYFLIGYTDSTDTCGVISGYSTDRTEADVGLAADEQYDGGGGDCGDGFCTAGYAQDVGGPTSCNYDDAECKVEYPETVYLFLK